MKRSSNVIVNVKDNTYARPTSIHKIAKNNNYERLETHQDYPNINILHTHSSKDLRRLPAKLEETSSKPTERLMTEQYKVRP
jgi:hypothetical protein